MPWIVVWRQVDLEGRRIKPENPMISNRDLTALEMFEICNGSTHSFQAYHQIIFDEISKILFLGTSFLVRFIAMWHWRRPGIPAPECGIKENYYLLKYSSHQNEKKTLLGSLWNFFFFWYHHNEIFFRIFWTVHLLQCNTGTKTFHPRSEGVILHYRWG